MLQTASVLVKDGCTRNEDCSDHATCQPDRGLCFCRDSYPNFLNYSQTYSEKFGCLISKSIRAGVGEYLNLTLTLQSNILTLL